MKILERKALPQIKGKLNASHEGGMFDCDPHMNLAAEIVASAATDWRELIKKKAWKKERQKVCEVVCTFEGLRHFFKSEWCAFLLQHFSVEPEGILKILEAELSEAIRKDEEQ